MPHTDSAWKRLRQNEKRRKLNKSVTKNLKLKRRALDTDIAAGDKTKVETSFKDAQAALDRAATKGYIHPNKAASLKSRAVKRLREIVAK